MAEQPTPEDLQHLIDGRLQGERLMEVCQHIARDPDLAHYVQDLRKTDQDLQRYGRELLQNLADDDDRGASRQPWQDAPTIDAAWPGTRLGAPPARRIAAMLSVVVVAALFGSGAGWWAHQSYENPTQRLVNRVVGDATSAYTYIGSGLGPSFDFTPEQNDAFGQWASDTFGITIDPPNFSAAGYSYIGARILPTADRTASLLAYRRDDSTITVYCWRDRAGQQDLPPRVQQKGYQVRLMSRNDVGIAVVAGQDVNDFDSAADAIFKAFTSLISARHQSGEGSGATG